MAGVVNICFSFCPEFTADVRGFLKFLTPSRWVFYAILIGLTNGDVRVSIEVLTEAPGAAGVPLGRLHLIAERGQREGWQYGSCQAPGSPWWKVNALTASFNV